MNKSSLEETIYSWEGWLFNFLCAGYFLLISPFVKEASIRAVKDEEMFIPWLGVCLLFVSLFEIYAFPKKMKYVHRAAIEHGEEVKSGFFLWMFHAVLSILIMFTIVESFGHNAIAGEGENKASGWLTILIFIVVIKELFLLFTVFGLHAEDDKLEEYKRPNNKEWMLDLILLVYACLAYTVTWEAMAEGMEMEKHNTMMYVFNLLAAGMMFLMFYMPLRIPYYIEEMQQLKGGKDILKFIFGILIVLISVLVGL